MLGAEDKYIRFYCALFFAFEKDHIYGLEKIEKKLGKYDFYCKPFEVLELDNLDSKFNTYKLGIETPIKVRIVSLKGRKKLTQFKKYFNMVSKLEQEILEQSNSFISLWPGYFYINQVVSASESLNNTSLRIDSDYLEKIELLKNGHSFKTYDLTSALFKNKRTVSFFNDASRILEKEIN